jgi:Transposase DDE domain
MNPCRTESRNEIETSRQNTQRIPSWFGEVVLWSKYWLDSALVGYLEEEVRVVRGRMGQYEVMDFVLVLISYAVSGERTIADFYRSLAPVKEALMNQWGRNRCPSASSLSRFLACIQPEAVEALRNLFESDLHRNSLRVKQGIGLFDRVADHSVVFDIDGTVCAARQRSIASDEQNDPPAQRRSDRACAPGYKGRKRGEVIRNRTTVSQAQTGEWLGTYGSAGNGDAKRELARSCQIILHYLRQQGLNAAHGIVRLDGLYGTASLVSIVQSTGLGYILRCRDYHLLNSVGVQQRLESARGEDWQLIAPSASELLDLGYIEEQGRGYTAPMRVIVVRTPLKKHTAKIGKRLKNQVYELFLTSQSSASFTGIDVLSLYRGRGGFEQRLSEEDQEQDYDRWCSWNGVGQEFWQILGQWSWNWRIWMGCQQAALEIRQTIWADEAPRVEATDNAVNAAAAAALPASLQFLNQEQKQPEPETQKEMTVPEYGPMFVSTEWGRALGKKDRFGNADFQIINEQTILCPAGNTMHRRITQPKANGDLKIQFGIEAKTCQNCPVKKRCLAPKSKGIVGRRVTVTQQLISPEKPGLPKMEVVTPSAIVRSIAGWLWENPSKRGQPIFWCDIAATRLRRAWHQELSLYEIGIEAIPTTSQERSSGKAPLLSRRQREHHRLSWWERNQRNARTKAQERWKVVMTERVRVLLAGLEKLSRRSFAATG